MDLSRCAGTVPTIVGGKEIGKRMILELGCLIGEIQREQERRHITTWNPILVQLHKIEKEGATK